MTLALVAALVVTVAGFLVLMDRKDKRAHREREAQREETRELLQRIQAPELATVRHDVEQVTEAPQPALDDDGYWQQEEDRRQAIARLEQLENAAIFGQG